MEPTQLALLALIARGGDRELVSLVIMASLRARDRLDAETSAAVPEGVAQVLHGDG